jgi:hypothetical protein
MTVAAACLAGDVAVIGMVFGHGFVARGTSDVGVSRGVETALIDEEALAAFLNDVGIAMTSEAILVLHGLGRSHANARHQHQRHGQYEKKIPVLVCHFFFFPPLVNTDMGYTATYLGRDHGYSFEAAGITPTPSNLRPGYQMNRSS